MGNLAPKIDRADVSYSLLVLLCAHAEGNLGAGQIAELGRLAGQYGQPLGSTISAAAFNRYFDKNGIDLRFGQAYSDTLGDIGTGGRGMVEVLALAVAPSSADTLVGTQMSVPERSGGFLWQETIVTW